MNRMK
jgi:hypothetical protein